LRRYVIRSLLRNRAFLETATMALALPFVAGMVNAEGFVIVGVYTSHVTGTVARAGNELTHGNVSGLLVALSLVCAFYVGAVTATALVALARRSNKARYSLALATEMMALLSITVLGQFQLARTAQLQPVITLLLCFSMGSQNALVTKLSGAIVRNTHLTGIVTDLGIESVRILNWYRTAPGTPVKKAVDVVKNLGRLPELKRMRLHLAIVASFFSGAVVGPLLHAREGYMAMLLPISVLIGLILFDTAIGLRSEGFGAASAELPRNVPAPEGAEAGESTKSPDAP
jgi:uncharacterized membrane protein YoaK (UPF0700 family)